MTINELRQKRNTVWEGAKAFLDSHRNEKGVLSAEDDAAYARMEQDITDLTREISRMERQEQLEGELSLPVNKPITEKPAGAKVDKKSGRAADSYNTAFWNHMRSKSNPEVRNALSEGTDTEGGFLVPEVFEKTLVKALDQELVIRQLAHTFQTSSNSTKIPVVSTRGAAVWTDEGSAIPETAHSFAQKSLTSHKLTALIKVSEELLADSAFALETYFRDEFARQIGNAEELAFVGGTGTNQPFGFFHDAEGGEVGVTTASATAITADEIIDLFHSLATPYRKDAVWVMNDATIQAIRKLKDDTKQYLWQPSMQAGTPDTILGRPVYASAAVPAIGVGNNVIAFGNLKYYWIGDREGITFRRLNERFADSGQVGFLATKRVDGRLILPEAVKILQMKSAT